MSIKRAAVSPLLLVVSMAACSSASAAAAKPNNEMALTSPFDDSTQASIIAHVKQVKASDLDASLQTIALDSWVGTRAQSGTVSWRATNCGPRADDPLLCAEVTFKTCSGELAYISIAAGMLRFGFHDPAIFSDAWIGGVHGKKVFAALSGMADAAPVCNGRA